MGRARMKPWLLLAILIVLPAIIPTGAASESGREVARCWPAIEGCAAKEYERKAAQAASRAADDRFGRDFPPGEWRVTCFPAGSPRKFQCSFHSIDPAPFDCTGGATLVKRDGRWRARDVEMSCSRG